jgi:hypothetical protein
LCPLFSFARKQGRRNRKPAETEGVYQNPEKSWGFISGRKFLGVYQRAKISWEKEGFIVTPQETADLIFTLEICLKSLPPDAHPVHRQRLRGLIEKLREGRDIR